MKLKKTANHYIEKDFNYLDQKNIILIVPRIIKISISCYFVVQTSRYFIQKTR